MKQSYILRCERQKKKHFLSTTNTFCFQRKENSVYSFYDDRKSYTFIKQTSFPLAVYQLSLPGFLLRVRALHVEETTMCSIHR